jgi:hypothetical protein
MILALYVYEIELEEAETSNIFWKRCGIYRGYCRTAISISPLEFDIGATGFEPSTDARLCPFCRKARGKLPKLGATLFQGVCPKCGASGPKRGSHQEALRAWNGGSE